MKIVNTESLQHLRALEATLAGTPVGGIVSGRGRITLADGKTLVFRDGHFELLTDEDVDGDARALGIGELETLVTSPRLSFPAASSRAYPPSCGETMARASSTSWSMSTEQS